MKKSEYALAKKLTIKKYLKLKIQLLEASLVNLEKQSVHFSIIENKLEKLLSDPAYIYLLSDYLSENQLEGKHWMNADYPKNMQYPEHLTHPTVGGLLVRSKSESMIAILLSERGIPFRYENVITINDVKIAPDFTILHPVTGKIYYWEHFGMIDNEAYCNEFTSKIKLYSKENILLSDNLIASFETKEHPLTYNMINNILNQYFY